MIDCWKWNKTEHKIHCGSKVELNAVLSEVRNSRKGGVYLIPGENREYDAIIPSKLKDAAVRIIIKHRAKNTKIPPIEPQRVTEAEIL